MLLFSLAGAFSYSSVTTLSPQHRITGIVLTVCAIMVFCRTLHTQRLPRTALALQILIILMQLSLPVLWVCFFVLFFDFFSPVCKRSFEEF